MANSLRSNADGTMSVLNGSGTEVANFPSTAPQQVNIGAKGITAGTAVTASGTSIDFTGIPSWAKRVTVVMSGISLSGTSLEMVQLGSGTIQTSGYSGSAWIGGGSASVNSNGFKCVSLNAATDVKNITMTLINISGTTWVASLAGAYNTAYISIGGGSVTLSGALDMVRVTSFNGTDTFDAGTINIMWEG